MVHANVGQKLLKRNIFKSFYRDSKLRSVAANIKYARVAALIR